jgi:hypothetical protein
MNSVSWKTVHSTACCCGIRNALNGVLLPSRGMAALPRGEAVGKALRSLRERRSPNPKGRDTRVLNASRKAQLLHRTSG